MAIRTAPDGSSSCQEKDALSPTQIKAMSFILTEIKAGLPGVTCSGLGKFLFVGKGHPGESQHYARLGGRLLHALSRRGLVEIIRMPADRPDIWVPTRAGVSRQWNQVPSKKRRNKLPEARSPGGKKTEPRGGFSPMSPSRRRKLGSIGGKISYEKGDGHLWTQEEAREASRIASTDRHRTNEGHRWTPEEARRAAQKAVAARAKSKARNRWTPEEARAMGIRGRKIRQERYSKILEVLGARPTRSHGAEGAASGSSDPQAR